jgi:hypothetical protein
VSLAARQRDAAALMRSRSAPNAASGSPAAGRRGDGGFDATSPLQVTSHGKQSRTIAYGSDAVAVERPAARTPVLSRDEMLRAADRLQRHYSSPAARAVGAQYGAEAYDDDAPQ